MKSQEIKGVFINPSASAKGFPDTNIEWYDFGGGHVVALNIPPKAGRMMALTCIRNGEFYYKVFEVEELPTKEDLASMFEEYAPAFAAEVESKSQETQHDKETV